MKLGTWIGKRLGQLIQKSSEVGIGTPAYLKLFGLSEDPAQIRKPYKQIPAVYAGTRAIALNISQVPWRVKREGATEPLTDGPIVWLFNMVNPTIGASAQLWEIVSTYLCIYGEAFIVKDGTSYKGVPVALWLPNPEQMAEDINQSGQLTGWTLKGGSRGDIKIPFELVIHVKYVNPWNAYRGLSPLESLKLRLRADYYGMRYNETFFTQGGLVGEVFSTEEHLTQAQFDRMRQQLIDARKGIEYAHAGILLDGGVTMQDARVTNKDMQFTEMHRSTVEEVLMVLKVPKSEVSIYEDVNYATALSQDASFWKKTLIPIMRLIAETMNSKWLRPELGLEGFFDHTAVDAINYEIMEKVSAAQGLYAMGVPFKLINKRLGLGFPDFEEEREEREEREDEERDVTPRRKSPFFLTGTQPADLEGLRGRAWSRIAAGVERDVAQCSDAVKEFFYRAERKLLRSLKQGHEKVAQDATRILSLSELIPVMDPFLDEAYQKGVQSAGGEIESFTRNGRVLLQEMDMQQVLDTVVRQIAEHMAEQDKDGEDNRAQSIREVLGSAKNRARTIARTEVFGAFNQGRQDALSRKRAPRKMWLSCRDERVRDSHRKVDGEVRSWNEPFSNGLQFPHDRKGPPGEIINCRCVLVTLGTKDVAGELAKMLEEGAW